MDITTTVLGVALIAAIAAIVSLYGDLADARVEEAASKADARAAEMALDDSNTALVHAQRRARDAEARQESLVQQVQQLAQRLATVRMQGAEPEERDFVAEPPTPEPFSQEIRDFLAGIESEQLREIVEERAYELRADGWIDEAIYEDLKEGEF